MAITSQGYDGIDHEIDEVGWAGISGSFGSAYSVRGLDGAPDESAGRVTPVSAAERTVAVAPAVFFGHGVRDRSDSTVNIQLPFVAQGIVRWFLVAVRRDWQANASVVTAVPDPQSTKTIPSQRLTQPGVQDDQPLALVQITGGQSIPTAIVDLRCWSGNGGLVAASTDALAYLDRLGSSVLVAGVRWDRAVDAQGSPVWTRPAPSACGPGSGTPNVFGQIALPHGLGYAPTYCAVTMASGIASGDGAVTESAVRDYTVVIWDKTPTDIIVRLVNRSTGQWAGSGSRFGFMWEAR